MALKLNTQYPGRFDPVSTDYPQGKWRNRSSSTANDGGYLEEAHMNDIYGFFGALLRNAEIVPDGTVDTARKSQFYEALIAVARKIVTDNPIDLSSYLKKSEIAQEWGDREDVPLSQKFLTDENERILGELGLKLDTSSFDGVMQGLASEISNKASIAYVDSSVAAVAGGSKSYKTLTEAEGDKENIPSNSSVYITNDGELTGLYNFNDGVFTKSEYDPVNQSKNYTDSRIDDVKLLENGQSLSNVTNISQYLLPAGYTYQDLPSSVDTNTSLSLRVTPISDAYVLQELWYGNAPYRVWKRRLHKTSGTGTWFYPYYNYNGILDNINPLTIVEDGDYLVTNPTNMPDIVTGSIYLNVKRVGSFTVRTAIQTSNPAVQLTNVNSSSWVNQDNTDLNYTNFTRDYSYRGLFQDGDFNNFIDTGAYLISGSSSNKPTTQTGSWYLSVEVFGAFILQVARNSNDLTTINQRRGFISGGATTWREWESIGGSSSSSSDNISSLNGKTIAFIGDSIVEGGNYPELIGSKYGATIHKFGFGGCRASYYPTNPIGYNYQCMYNIAKCISTDDYSTLISGAEYTRDNHNDNNVPQATAMSMLDWNKVDVLCIAFGTNDWTSQNGLGTDLVADPEGKTYKGALCYSVEEIQKKYPHLQIILIGMSFRLRLKATPEENSDNTPNSLGEYLNQYQQALLDVGEKYHIPAYNFYKESALNEYNYSYYLQDAVHPNNTVGYKHWASKIGSFLNSTI